MWKVLDLGSGLPHKCTLIEAVVSTKCFHKFMRLIGEARVDNEWQYTFVPSWNGSVMMLAGPCTSYQVTVTSDVSGCWGCGDFMEEA